KNMSCEKHYWSDSVAVQNSEGMMTSACRVCVEESTAGFRGGMGIEVDLKLWGPAEKMKQRTLFNRWFSELLLQDDKSCLLRDVLRNQKENLWSEWQRVRPFEEGDE